MLRRTTSSLSNEFAGHLDLVKALAREEAARRIQEKMERAREKVLGPAPAARFQVRIDDAADLSIYQQIIAQIQEAVATGVLEAGERLPAVRRLADQLDIAPGTVARAYSELERLGIVVTRGSRGTRVAERKRSSVSETERPDALVGLIRPVAVAAFHLGASAEELRQALDDAMKDIFPRRGG